MKKILLLGSTGSIGQQTLEVVRQQKKFKVVGLACRNNIALLQKQINEFSPSFVC
ncbi:MAG: 1-deoxy-D-xylulose 5-phosphate reductoisomerase, partial [Parcubacteria group bacterium GW2011_GWC1_41_7]